MHAAAAATDAAERVSAAMSAATSVTAESAATSAAVVRRPLSPRKFFAMLYETDTAVAPAAVRRPRGAGAPTAGKDADGDGPRWPRPAVPAAYATVSHRHHTAVATAAAIVRPAAAYVEHSFSAGLTAFRE